MKPEILLGDEAVALGAIHAGLTSAFSYPGTPASEVMEYLLKTARGAQAFRAAWCINEKVAYEEALGVSFAGLRTMVSMKHVGLNVAADPFMNSALTGVGGGLVVVSADDPGMHSSQDEQDNRYYADFARIPCFEPSNHQEAYDMTRRAFDVSEEFGVPVLVRLVTRLSHSRSSVVPREPRAQNTPPAGKAGYGPWDQWTLLPINARKRFRALVEKQADLTRMAEGSEFNRLEQGHGRVGIIASGIAYNYVMENLRDASERPPILKLSVLPVPVGLVASLVKQVDTIIVVEEGYPLIERALRGLFGIEGKVIKGKLSGEIPATGELSPEAVRPALGLKPLKSQRLEGFKLASRPPQLCKGCPHADTFRALKAALEGYPKANVFSDIGCYTLGAFPPYQAVNTCVCMGASVSMAKGGSEVGIHPAVAVLGDSTFGHSGLTPLVEAAALDSNMTVIILDNGTVAMTGGQASYATGERLLKMIEGAGVGREHLRVIEPLPKNLEANAAVMREEFDHRGLSVIVAVRECIQEARKRKRQTE
ncbi:MAG TPA: thiamine pyrophosphate-dependent enzyme [bacterium]|nr:thiamine pyrophosphate-dependent enzyme [bacterium]